MSEPVKLQIDKRYTVWRPDPPPRQLILAAILQRNPIPIAYRVNYLANFYVGPLIKQMEQAHRMTRPEWIVLFCLHQRNGINAQQISDVTGRPKTSISAAIKQLQTKKLITRETDVEDARRQVVNITEAGQRMYAKILQGFIARESEMTACLSGRERDTFLSLLDKLVTHGHAWAKSY